ncbi:MAG: single-stranded DNA-binding protein, partial [Pyrinomonadaceae bacterium]
MSFNKIILVGNLGKDPELRYTPQGTPVCSFTMATNEKRKGASGEMQDTTTWFRITLWNKQAENASKYLTKGRPVYIEGRLRIEEWTDKDGKTRSSLEVHATDMQFIGNRSDESGGGRDYSGGSDAAPPRQNFQDSKSSGRTSGGGGSDDVDDFEAGGSGATDEDIP